jgi:hypothetical protein
MILLRPLMNGFIPFSLICLLVTNDPQVARGEEAPVKAALQALGEAFRPVEKPQPTPPQPRAEEADEENRGEADKPADDKHDKPRAQRAEMAVEVAPAARPVAPAVEAAPARRIDLLGGFRAVFQPEQKKGADDDIPPDMLKQFMPHLNKLLVAEIHFLRKVCQPDPETLARLRQAGEEEIVSIAKMYARLMRKNQHSGFPDARELLSFALKKKAEELLPAAAARRYREELTARTEAGKQATQAMMTVILDRHLALTPQQYDQVAEAVGENWKEDWGQNLQVFLYDEYAPVPGPDVLNPLLNDRQRELLKDRANHGRIHFGWEQDIAVFNWGVGVALEELDEYPGEEAQ